VENAEFGYSFKCKTCPYLFMIDTEYYSRRKSKVKQVDDVMGGAAAWENVDQTNGPRPRSPSTLLLLLLSFLGWSGADE
jgi:DNA-directed RNA polymerase III subunit RPC11